MDSNKDGTAKPFDAAHGSARSDCYVGIKPCGCMVAWVHDSPEHQKDTAKSVAQFIKDGYRVEAAITADIRSKLGPCRCKSWDNARAVIAEAEVVR